MVRFNSEDFFHFKKPFFVGIGGVGMSALARVLKHRGFSVSGSDEKRGPSTNELQQEGIHIVENVKELQLGEVDVMVYSSAIGEDHPAIQFAKEHRIPLFHRANVLANLMSEANTSIAVTGTHGKTTVASMLSYVLDSLDRNPTCLVGGKILNRGTNTLLGDNQFYVAEVDESDKSHEWYSPNYVILTNLELDHTDHYQEMTDVITSFKKFIGNLHDPGTLVVNGDDRNVLEVIDECARSAITFGFNEENVFKAQNLKPSEEGIQFEIIEAGFYAHEVKLAIPGEHNVLNALAVFALLTQFGVEPSDIIKALGEFKGAGRRMEVLHKSDDLTVLDDYAHHPTEVKAVINALKPSGKSVTVVFQPHRYSRVEQFAKEFAESLELADRVVLTDIFAAGEKRDNADVLNSSILNYMKKHSYEHVEYISFDNLTNQLLEQEKRQGIIAFLGAGSISEKAHQFADNLPALNHAV